MSFSRATESTEQLQALWSVAIATAATTRGGEALLSSISGDEAVATLLEHLVRLGGVFQGTNDVGELITFAIVRDDVIQALYVAYGSRRQGVARGMLEWLHGLERPPIDAYALPGDRGTKSLYESFGWKARLLTMRAE